MVKNTALIVFVKNNVPGTVKTRLAKDVGAQKASEVYELLIQHTKKIVRPLQADLFVFYNETIEKHDCWRNEHVHKYRQQGNSLGEKMSHAFKLVLQEKDYESACIIGSDCYELSTELIESAYQALQHNEFVIGPANDGGYYLLGMKNFHPFVFQQKQWSTSTVFEQTIADISVKNHSVHSLPVLNDIDYLSDLESSELNYEL